VQVDIDQAERGEFVYRPVEDSVQLGVPFMRGSRKDR